MATGSMITAASCMRQAAMVMAPTSGSDANTAPAELFTVSCTTSVPGVMSPLHGVWRLAVFNLLHA